MSSAGSPAAAVPGTAPLTMNDPGVAALAAAADGSLGRFIRLALEAIEDAADRAAASIDEAAVAAAVEAVAAAESGSDELE